MISFYIGLAIAIVPFVFGQSLAGAELPAGGDSFVRLYYFIAAYWVILFTPPLTSGFALTLAIIDALTTNLVVAICTDMLASQRNAYRLSSAVLCNTNFGIGAATVVAYAIYSLVYGSTETSNESSSTSFEGQFEALSADNVAVQYLNSLTLFFGVASIIATALSGILRQYVNKRYMHSQYTNCLLYTSPSPRDS